MSGSWKSPFFDYLGLAELDPENFDWLVFCGVSGSGKTTSINWLRTRHQNHPFTIIDEIQTVSELLSLLRDRKTGTTYLVASHVPAWIHAVIRPAFAKQKIFRTDRNYGQIEEFLRANEVSFSPLTLGRFLRKYDASFVDLKTILESSPDRDFDQAFYLFEKLNRIERTPE